MICKVISHFILNKMHLIKGSSNIIIYNENLAKKAVSAKDRHFIYKQRNFTPLEHYPILASY